MTLSVSAAKFHSNSRTIKHSKNVPNDIALFMITPPYNMLYNMVNVSFFFFRAVFTVPTISDMFDAIGTMTIDSMNDDQFMRLPNAVMAATIPSATKAIISKPRQILKIPSAATPCEIERKKKEKEEKKRRKKEEKNKRNQNVKNTERKKQRKK